MIFKPRIFDTAGACYRLSGFIIAMWLFFHSIGYAEFAAIDVDKTNESLNNALNSNLTYDERKLIWAADTYKKSVVYVFALSAGGTGVIVEMDGRVLVLTNDHIIQQSKECIVQVLKKDGKPGFLWGKVIAQSKDIDVAIIEIKYEPGKAKGFLNESPPSKLGGIKRRFPFSTLTPTWTAPQKLDKKECKIWIE